MKSYWPTFGVPLSQFASIAGELDEQSLIRRYAAGFLIRFHDTMPTLGIKATLLPDERPATTTVAAKVMPLHPRPTSDNGLIAVGRLDGNDVAINDAAVSKYHAFFRQAAGGEFSVQDAGSKNGTFVGTAPVAVRGQGEPTKLVSAQTVRFGCVTTTFLTAAAFLELIRR